jgi:hypothetical protein
VLDGQVYNVNDRVAVPLDVRLCIMCFCRDESIWTFRSLVFQFLSGPASQRKPTIAQTARKKFVVILPSNNWENEKVIPVTQESAKVPGF